MNKKKTLYLAIAKSQNGALFIDQFFYENEDQAKDWLEDAFVQLWRSGPTVQIRDSYELPKRNRKIEPHEDTGQMDFSKFFPGAISEKTESP